MVWPFDGWTSSIAHAPATTPGGDATPSTGGDITGRFDPTALERGAKALKLIDASPNAAKAFEATRLLEATKKHEALKETEKYKAQAAQSLTEKARVEGDERRKTATHQQEQQRITAQYQAQLEAELYTKKLSSQQKQNAEWLEQQHQQFLHQEELKLENERRMQAMRREEIIFEKSLESKSIKAKTKTEAMGRIKQERLNADIHLQKLKAAAAEKRQSQLLLWKQNLSSVGAAVQYLLSDRRRAGAAVATMASMSFAVYGSKQTARVVASAVEAHLGRPRLVRETSRRSINNISLGRMLTSPIRWSYRCFHRRAADDILSKLVLPPSLDARVKWSTNALLNSRRYGTPYRHLLLHGPPGTGKTLFARTLARETGFDYAIMAGGDVASLGTQAVLELNKLFRWARTTRKGLIMFIDEADALLRRGRGGDESKTYGAMSEELRNVVSTFLHQTGTESDKVCIVLATNEVDTIDRAVVDRIDEMMEFPLPGLKERICMLKMFVAEQLLSKSRSTRRRRIAIDPGIDETFWNTVAEKTEGFSGRQILKLVLSMQAAAYGAGAHILTKGIAETVLKWRMDDLTDSTSFS
eukprot:Lankesteria_metandrocarpae@DN7249_c0_g1_i1.p1